uniref:CCHC-type domain-containing protein n=1 Tax=Tanacetum cinerariifolium TaxID=118510 RepID=A0A6L2JWM6_TANCI|nr:hypothetical protein [Tanacetum cinerariifolium]
MATKGNLGEVVTTCERSWVQALPWGFSFRSEKEWGLSPKAKVRVLDTAQLDVTNGVNIPKLIDEGPFQIGTLRETLTEGTEGALHLRPERPRVYSDLTSKDKDRGQGNNAWGTGAAGYGGAQNRVGYANPGQARHTKCYNCNGIGHLARNCTQPKRIQNSKYFKDKMLLMQAQENRVALNEEQLLFIASGQDNAVDEDVDEQPTIFMANLSSTDPVYDKAGPSYASDSLSEVHDHDHYQGAVCEHHEVHEMHYDVQPNYGVDSHVDYMSDNNMILYDQYVKDNIVPVVQSNVSAIPNDAYMMILNDMHEPPV